MRGARIIGPNCLGIIVPDVIKMGGIGGPAKDAAKSYTPGPVGVMSRSGGMTTEISSTLSAAGLGQSTAVSIGGDAIIGSTYAELMPLFEADEQTEAIVIYTEPGGRMEAQLARWVSGQRLAPADRRVHGRPLHGRDARHVLRPRGNDRRGQGGHRDREDRPPRRGRDHGRRGDRRDPRPGEGQARGAQRPREGRRALHRRRGRRRAGGGRRAGGQAHRGLPGGHLRPAGRRRACASSRRTSTSACSAACASPPRPRARSR